MEIIIQYFDKARTLLELKKNGYFIVSTVNNRDIVHIKFIKRTKEETDKLLISSNLADILDGLYGC